MTAFSIVAVVERGLRIFFDDLPLFLGLGLLVNAPIVASAMLGQSLVEPDFAEPGLAMGLAMLTFVVNVAFTIVARALTTGALLHGVFRRLRGERTTVGQSLRTALTRLGPILAYALLSGLATVVGFALCIVPGLVLVTMWYVGLPAVVAEEVDALAALERSRQLTADHRWEIVLLVILVFGVELVIDGALAGITTPGLGWLWSATPLLAFAVESVIRAVFTAINAVFAAVAYHDLRVSREGVESADLAAVFD